MDELSKGFRNGILIEQSTKGYLNFDKVDYPFITIQMLSKIPIGFGEVSEEKTNVCLIGAPIVDAWEKANPSVGDGIRISYATSYVKNGTLCMRVDNPDHIEIEHVCNKDKESQTISDKLEKEEQSSNDDDTVNALDFFRAFLSEKNS